MSEEKKETSPQTPRKISISDARHFDREGFSGDVLIEPENNLGYNALRVDVHGHHPKKQITDGVRSYFVAEGTGTFTINGVLHEVKQGDLYVIPTGGEYEYQGKMTLFEFNIPGDSWETSVTLDN